MVNETKSAGEEAVRKLSQLRELAEYQTAQLACQQRLQELRARHQSRHSRLKRLDRAGLN